MSHLKKKKVPVKQKRKTSSGSVGIIIGIILLVIILAGGGSLAYISPGRAAAGKLSANSRMHVIISNQYRSLTACIPA